MGRTSQVRLEPDVVAHLDRDPDLVGLSLSAAANRALRGRYADDGLSVPVAAASAVNVDRGRLTAGRRQTGRCRCGAPLSRAVGNRCGWCGASV